MRMDCACTPARCAWGERCGGAAPSPISWPCAWAQSPMNGAYAHTQPSLPLSTQFSASLSTPQYSLSSGAGAAQGWLRIRWAYHGAFSGYSGSRTLAHGPSPGLAATLAYGARRTGGRDEAALRARRLHRKCNASAHREDGGEEAGHGA